MLYTLAVFNIAHSCCSSQCDKVVSFVTECQDIELDDMIDDLCEVSIFASEEGDREACIRWVVENFREASSSACGCGDYYVWRDSSSVEAINDVYSRARDALTFSDLVVQWRASCIVPTE